MNIELKLLKYFITNYSFTYKGNSVISTSEIDYNNMNCHFEKKIGKNGKDETLIKIIFVHESDETHPFDICVEINGIFELKNWESSKETQFVMLENTTAILFPYLRELVSNITMKALGKAFIIPVVNTYSLFNKEEKR